MSMPSKSYDCWSYSFYLNFGWSFDWSESLNLTKNYIIIYNAIFHFRTKPYTLSTIGGVDVPMSYFDTLYGEHFEVISNVFFQKIVEVISNIDVAILKIVAEILNVVLGIDYNFYSFEAQTLILIFLKIDSNRDNFVLAISNIVAQVDYQSDEVIDVDFPLHA